MPVESLPRAISARTLCVSPALVALCAIGCAAPAQTPVTEVTLAPLAKASTTGGSDARALDADGCVLTAKAVVRRFEIALSPGGQPFAHVTRAREAKLSLGGDGAIGIDVDAGGVTLVGFVSNDETGLFPARPLVLSGGLVPFGWAELRFRGIEPGGVRVALAPEMMPQAVKDMGDDEPSGVFSCDAFSLTPESFDPAAILSAPSTATATLSGDAALLSPTPDGDARFSIWPDAEAPPVVRVVGKSGARARVTWAHENVLLYGWVDSDVLGPSTEPPRAPIRPQPEAASTPALRASVRATCKHEVPIAAEVNGEARFIGHVAAGKVMGLELDETGGFLLAVEGAGFAPQSYSEIRVRNDDLRGCRLRR